MSGPIPSQVAQAAQGFAFAAEAAAFGISPRELCMLKSKASLLDASEARAKAGQLSTAARWWRDAPARVRTVLMNLGQKAEGDAYAKARLPWDALSAADQISIASVGAELFDGLKGVDCLSW